jgi:hypothetical protein
MNQTPFKRWGQFSSGLPKRPRPVTWLPGNFRVSKTGLIIWRSPLRKSLDQGIGEAMATHKTAT